MAALANPASNVGAEKAPGLSHGLSSKFRGMSKEDITIAERLQKLKDEPSTCTYSTIVELNM